MGLRLERQRRLAAARRLRQRHPCARRLHAGDRRRAGRRRAGRSGDGVRRQAPDRPALRARGRSRLSVPRRERQRGRHPGRDRGRGVLPHRRDHRRATCTRSTSCRAARPATALVVDQDGSACDANASPFIDDCDYDQAGEILRWIYPDLVGRPGPATGRRIVFDQTEFLAGAVGWGRRARGRGLHPGRLRGRAGLPGAHRVPRLPAEPDHRRHRRPVHRAHRATCATPTPTGSCCSTRRPTPTPRRTRAGTGGAMRRRTTSRRAAPQLAAVRAMLDRLAEPREDSPAL